ncbi:MAG TPA: hypothetical protein VG096_25405 [Bryobacteraceae bacterium]|nr:hypothetical protein [Bryobacteraceae bacterium]
MFRLGMLAFLIISLAVILTAATIPSSQPGGLTIHEWGTFTSVAGEDGSAITWNVLGCKSDLPRFVKDFGYRGLKLGVSGTVRMETPVLYFYSPREVEAHVKVTFPQGLLTEWYPQAEYEVHQKGVEDGSTPALAPGEKRDWTPAPRNVAGCMRCHNQLNGVETQTQNLTGTLEWSRILVQPGTSPSLPVESEPSRYYAARQTDAAPISVAGQQEKFLFYRGVGAFPIPLSARISGEGQVVVENQGQPPVPVVIRFENREGKIGFRNAGALRDTATIGTPELNDSFPALRQVLETALIGQGLFPKEAQAMVETWRDSWFEEGSRLIYIVPAPAIDAILPLQVEPAPVRTVRVFVGRVELITAETKQSVESALARSDWPAVDRYNRFLDPIFKRIYAANAFKASESQQLFRNYQTSSAACR